MGGTAALIAIARAPRFINHIVIQSREFMKINFYPSRWAAQKDSKKAG